MTKVLGMAGSTARLLRIIGAMLVTSMAPAAANARAIPVAAAGLVFARAHALCSADGGRLWGISLCGPLMLADPRSRAAISNVPLPGAVRTGALYAFTLPADTPIADAPFQYDGIRFAQIVWPLTGSADEQAVTLMHESFHRIQPELGFVVTSGRSDATTIAGDPSLDTEAGRIWLRGEMHALRVALRSRGAGRRTALVAALELRAYRHAIIPATVAPEHELDIMEGLAESTAIDVGLPRSRRIAYTLHDIAWAENAPSYARTFCYAIGPAYSELLDAAEPDWRRQVTPKTSIAALTARVYGILVRTPTARAAQAILARYGGAAIEREEAAREASQLAREARYRAEFVAGPVLRLPMRQFRISFSPADVQRFGHHGSIYHQVIVSAPWGRIVVSDGDAMIDGSFHTLTIAAPCALRGSTLHGRGWVLTLSPGARVVPDPKRPGSYTVTLHPTAAS